MKKSKVVLITGCSSGLGYETAIWLSSQGHKVYATMRNLEKKKRLEDAAKGMSLTICELDVEKPDTIAKCIDEILQEEGRLDVLVNNAGFVVLGEFIKSTNLDFERQLSTNFYGALNCARTVIPIMKKQQQGLIINVSSILGLIGIPRLSAYCASKFAMEGWSESIRCELAKDGIFVSLLEPGFFETDIYSNVNYVSKEKDKATVPSMGASPLKVAKKISRIISSRKPARRYKVGYDSVIGSMVKRYFPEFFSEKILNRS